MQDDGGEDPHDCAEDEHADGEGGVVDGGLLCFAVAAAPVRVEYEDADGERYAGDDEKNDLRPGLRARCPGWEVAAGRERAGGVEDGHGGAEHGKDDEGA